MCVAMSQSPGMINGDIFRVIVPLDDEYSYDVRLGSPPTENRKSDTVNFTVNDTQTRILELMRNQPRITAKELSEKIGITERSIKNNIKKLKEAGLVERNGADRNGKWHVN